VPDHSDAGPAMARRAVEALNSVFYEAIESGDLDTMQDLWLDSPDTVCVHPGALPVRGTGAIARSWALVMASTSYIQYFLTDVEVSLRGTTASVTCTENVLTGDERSGVDSFGGGLAVATNVFLHTDAGWRLWVHHSSLVVPAGDHDDE
jgi:ketosteroid isomerase-like protein